MSRILIWGLALWYVLGIWSILDAGGYLEPQATEGRSK